MRRAIVVPIVKALGSLGSTSPGSQGPAATQLMCATALVLHCMRPISTHGLRGSIEALAFRGDGLLALRGPPARFTRRTPNARPVWPLACAQIGFSINLFLGQVHPYAALWSLGHGSASMALTRYLLVSSRSGLADCSMASLSMAR